MLGKASSASVLHVGIAEVGNRMKVLLNRAVGAPAQQVPDAPSLVVGTRRPAATKGLLANHGPGWFVIDVKITRTVLQGFGELGNHATIFSIDGTGEGIRRGRITEDQSFL